MTETHLVENVTQSKMMARHDTISSINSFLVYLFLVLHFFFLPLAGGASGVAAEEGTGPLALAISLR